MPGGNALLAMVAAACVFASTALADGGKDALKPDRHPMPTTQPMPTKMAKPGMKVGDVKKAEKKMERRMEPVLEKDESAMPKK